MCLNEKKAAFLNGDKELVRDKRKEFRGRIRKAKLAYKDKIESRLYTGNAKKAWEGLNSIMGREKMKQVCSLQGAPFVEDLNVFFTRFDGRNVLPNVREYVLIFRHMSLLNLNSMK